MYIVHVGAVVGENSHFDSVFKSNIVGRRIVSAEQTSINDTTGNCFISPQPTTPPFDLQSFAFEKLIDLKLFIK
jgi:hypothetical protein